MRPELPTGTVTFLFTDIEGSTRLLHALGPDAYAEALAEHRRLLRKAFAAHDGVEVDTQGDAFFVAFPTAPGAAAAALAGRAALAPGPISVRMGLHTGTPTVTNEGYVGADVHRGARVAGLAHGGQVLVTEQTRSLLSADVTVTDLGQHRVKDFEGFVRVVQLGDAAFPPLRTPGAVDLPIPATTFLGRESELLEAVSLWYEREPRVLSVVGPGGTGKTRFTLELARLLAEDADGGTVFVPLAPLRDPAFLLASVAELLGAASADAAALASRIGVRRTHLVLDNVEQLLPAAASQLASLVSAAPAVRLLVTSREPLRIAGETEFDLPPMNEADGVTLFLDRARAVMPDLAESADVNELVRRLDGLPLAVELAAARAKLLAPGQLLGRLGRRLDILKGSRDADDRHATLRATIAWSHDLLDPDEKELFARLAVFRGSFALETAEQVCDADLDTLASLLDKSLLRRRLDAAGRPRFWMLETIREFAGEQLEASDDAARVHERHAEEMLRIARSATLTEDDDTPFDLPAVLAELDDLRAALDWASVSHRTLALELAIALENLWTAHAPQEGVERFEALLGRAASDPPEIRARALRTYGGALDMSGRREDAERLHEESLAVFRELGDRRGIASLTHRVAMNAFGRGDYARARRLAEESLGLSRDRFPLIEIPNYAVLGQVLVADGDVDGGTELVRRGADLARDVGWDWWLSGQLGNLAFLALGRGDLVEAERTGAEALRLEREHGNRHWALYSLTALARVALARGDPERAGLYWGAVQAEGAKSRYGAWEASRIRLADALTTESGSEFVAGRERGCEIDFWDVAAAALEWTQTEP
jgi:predicted ATPase/class 3 adenylate cyclase